MTRKYMGLHGKPLMLAVSIVATTGFLLFGYDREPLQFKYGKSLANDKHRGRHVGHHYRWVTLRHFEGCASSQADTAIAPAFNDNFPATKNNSTMQGLVTAIYEIGNSYIHNGTTDSTAF